MGMMEVVWELIEKTTPVAVKVVTVKAPTTPAIVAASPAYRPDLLLIGKVILVPVVAETCAEVIYVGAAPVSPVWLIYQRC
jgi:hypothetical protein